MNLAINDIGISVAINIAFMIQKMNLKKGGRS